MYQKFTLALYARLICAGDIAARIYQPGYLGYRGERQKIYLVLEYEYRLSLTSSSISVRLSAPQENLLWGGEWCICQGVFRRLSFASRSRFPPRSIAGVKTLCELDNALTVMLLLSMVMAKVLQLRIASDGI